jgi:cytoskeletal protein CcmA (bactofilin family)
MAGRLSRGALRLARTLAVFAALPALALADGRAGSQLGITEPVAEDLYATAGTLVLDTTVAGDAVLAAGTLTLAGDVASDALLAGGTVDIDGVVGDDLRAAGGTVNLRGLVTDQAIVAGGAVTFAADSAVGGRAWIAANAVDVQGQVAGDLRVTGARVSIAGSIGGNAEVTGREVRIEPGAFIAGDLVVRGTAEPVIAEDARILGDVVTVPDGADAAAAEAAPGIASRLLLALAVFLAAAVLWRLFPALVERAGGELRAAPGRTLLGGVLALAGSPVLILVLFGTVVGWLLALVLVAAFALAVAAAGLLALAAIAGLVASRAGAAAGWGRRLALLALVSAGVVLLQAVPGLGGLVTVVLWVAGLGMLVRVLQRRPAAGLPIAPG